MKFGRFESQGKTFFGLVEGDQVVPDAGETRARIVAALPEERRTKTVYVISTDTLVENPVVAAWVSEQCFLNYLVS